jgi:hypothetical protein
LGGVAVRCSQCDARRDTMGFLGVSLACGRSLLAMA